MPLLTSATGLAFPQYFLSISKRRPIAFCSVRKKCHSENGLTNKGVAVGSTATVPSGRADRLYVCENSGFENILPNLAYLFTWVYKGINVFLVAFQFGWTVCILAYNW